MKFKNFISVFALVFLFLSGFSLDQVKAQPATDIPDPESFFGFIPGAEGKLFNYDPLINYLKQLDESSPRLKMVEIGKSPMGKLMYIAFISSEENIRNLDRLKEINRRLALDPGIPDNERESLIDEGRVFFLATLSMHSGEVTPAQSSPLIAYDLVTTSDPDIIERLDNVVYMMVPNHNPDGMDMIVNHYNKYIGTKYEGASMPGLYHKYVGHDNNRDFVILSQDDNRAISKIYSTEWFPQVMVEKHQMGSTGPRYFVPPFHDPIAENIDAGIFSWQGVFGLNMMKDMTAEGLAGVSQHTMFDNYWPGSTETCDWKNVIGMLTEMASIKGATSVYIEPNELSVRGKGLAEYKKSINMPMPWEGGWWTFEEMIKYEISSTMSIIKTASLHRKDILSFKNDLCRRQVKKGQTQAPYYYILPLAQHDNSEMVKLVNLLKEHGLEVYSLSAAASVGNKEFSKGDIVIPLAQPFRAFLKEVMERQQFPERHYTPGGELISPYDITSWSLPLHRGVKSFEMNYRSEDLESKLQKIEGSYNLNSGIPEDYQAAVFSVNNNESFQAAFSALGLGLKTERLEEEFSLNGKNIPRGSFIIYNNSKSGSAWNDFLKNMNVTPLFLTEKKDINTTVLTSPRIALVETWFHDMDAGWTRYLFDTYKIPFKVIRPGDFETTDFVENYDVVVFPNTNKSILMTGKYSSSGGYYRMSYPPEYVKGMGKKGMDNLMKFVDNGGVVVSWGQSTALFMGNLEIPGEKEKKEEFQLPVRDISQQFRTAGLNCPGSFMKVYLKEDHPLTYGTPGSIGVFYRGSPAFGTSIPDFDMDRRVIAKFPEKDILLSGYADKEEVLGNRSVMVWAKKGKGQFVLFGFNPQFRASTQVSFKLLFNSLLLPRIK